MPIIKIGILIFNGLTALDAVGPYDILSKLPGAQISFVSSVAGPVVTTGGLQLVADQAINNDSLYDVIIIPGGSGIHDLMDNQEVLTWVKKQHAHSKYTVSVCTGALLLGQAGILKGIRATTHWMHLDALNRYDAIPVTERYIREGKIITSAGVSAGMDMSLKLAELLTNVQTAQAIQLAIEYDPDPPFQAGSPETAPEEIVEMLMDRLKAAGRPGDSSAAAAGTE